MLDYKIDINYNFLPPKKYVFECQTYRQLIRLLTTLYFNIGTFENVKVTLPSGYFENGFYITGDSMVYIDKRFLDNYWRDLMHLYCPCDRDPFVFINPHAKNFMRFSYRSYPLFAVVYALRWYYNYYVRPGLFKFSPYYYYSYRQMPCVNPIPMSVKTENKEFKIYVPCGRCYSCQSAKRGAFALRCRSQLELYKNYGSSYFITLTYDDDHLFSYKSRSVVRSYLRDQYQLLEKDRSYSIFLLEKKKFSLFMRKLRRHLKNYYQIPDFKFIASGEYGTLHNRPHYHFLFFSPRYIRDDFLHDVILKLWSCGTVEVQTMCDANINYVGKHSVKSDLGCQYQQMMSPAFMLYSLKGGSVGCHLKHSNFYWNLYKSGQKFVKMGKYKYYFPRYLSKSFHPENMTSLELLTLEKSTGEMFDKYMYLYDTDTGKPLFVKSRLMRDDYFKRKRYESLRLLKKVKKIRKSIF